VAEPVRLSDMLASAALDLTLDAGKDQPVQLHLPASIVDVDAHQVTRGVVVEYNAFRNLAALDTRVLQQIDIERIGAGMLG
jgi:hypothetical protein